MEWIPTGNSLLKPTSKLTTIGLADILEKLAFVGKLTGLGSFALFSEDALCGKVAFLGKLVSCGIFPP
jgi:hypothetical protein